MSNAQSSTGSAVAAHASVPHPSARVEWPGQPASALLGSASHKFVRFGSLDRPCVSLVRKYLLPSTVVLTLAVCWSACRQPLNREFYAMSLVTFLVCREILSPLHLRQGQSAPGGSALSRILLEWVGVVVLLLVLSTCFGFTPATDRTALLSWIIVTPFALLLAFALSVPLVRWLSFDRSIAHRSIIIGVNDAGLELSRRIATDHSCGTFFGFLDYRGAHRLGTAPAATVTGDCSARDFAEFVRAHAITHVYLTLPMSKAKRTEELLTELRDTTASIFFVPDLFAFDLIQPRCVQIDGMPALSICDSPFQGMNGLTKRVFDVLLALLALLLGWPVLLLIALAVKLSSPGPILFKQRRYGLNGEEFLVYKFRTMTVCEDGAVVAQATPKDRRFTKVGEFLRRRSWDELPQLLNVIEGKMSFVGPRPHAVAHNEMYRKLIDGYMTRHKVRPGITGWAQVNGLRGETSSAEAMQRRVQCDLEYLKNWSLALDIEIIAKTALLLLHDRNAY
jgi:putative colanic acid biosysnthesis UDP-glucose lipid carrier transferase